MIVLAAIPASYFGLKNYCSLQQHREYENPNGARTSEQHAPPQGQQSDPTATFNLSVTDKGKIEGRYYAKDKPKEKEDWTEKFWCDAKIGEFSLVAFTLFLVLFTGGLWFSTHRLWIGGEKQLTATQRPWVKIHSVEAWSDLTFTDASAKLMTCVTVENYGNSPGVRVRVDLKIVCENGSNLRELQAAFARPFRRPPAEFTPEITSWPKDKISYPQEVFMEEAELDRCRAIASANTAPVLRLALIGCITYEFSFAPGMHQTSIIYRIEKKTPYAGAHLYDVIANARGAVRSQGTIDQNDLLFLIGSDGTGPVD
ncbi:MAG: hypothetical protein WCG00_07730 [Hyphomicrobiales bacterium]